MEHFARPLQRILLRAFKNLNHVGLAVIILLGSTVLSIQGTAQSQDTAQSTAQHHNSNSETAPTLDQLLTAFSSMEGLEADFVEKKSIGMLAAPLESRGSLYFSSPGYLLRRVEEPQQVEVLITPEQLEVREDGTKVEQFDLRTRKDIAHFVESFVWILAGDKEALEKAYTLDFQQHSEHKAWTLRLTPKDAQLSSLIEQLVVEGQGFHVRTITVKETSGDTTVTNITNANPDRVFSPDEHEELFGQPHP